MAVGERGGNAVDHEADPANPEIGARAEPSNGDSRILREVVGVKDEDARDGAERLVEGELSGGELDGLAVDCADGGGDFRERRRQARGGDDHRVEVGDAHGRLLCRTNIRRDDVAKKQEKRGGADEAGKRHGSSTLGNTREKAKAFAIRWRGGNNESAAFGFWGGGDLLWHETGWMRVRNPKFTRFPVFAFDSGGSDDSEMKFSR